MAKAGDTTSKIDGFWLREALERAIAAFRWEPLAKERLREWLTTKGLPWTCHRWEGLDAAGLAKLKREFPGAGSVDEYGNVTVIPAATYAPGDPQFWSAQLKIDWEDNTASELAMKGARAWGIQVSRIRLLELLPEVPREHVEAPEQTKPVERERMQPKAWLAWARKEHPRRQNEYVADYADRLHGLMLDAVVTRVWGADTLRRRLYDS